jgi:hypothetical protein
MLEWVLPKPHRKFITRRPRPIKAAGLLINEFMTIENFSGKFDLSHVHPNQTGVPVNGINSFRIDIRKVEGNLWGKITPAAVRGEKRDGPWQKPGANPVPVGPN